MAEYSGAGTHVCRVCRQEKPISAFYIKNGVGRVQRKTRYDTRCRSCANVAVAVWQSKNSARVLQYKRKHYETKGRFVTRDRSYKKFNADQAAYDLQFHAQHERCAICLRAVAEGENRFAFDHDHTTGLARGVLCPSCNGGLGNFRDRSDLLIAAIRYLEYWEEQHQLAVANGI